MMLLPCTCKEWVQYDAIERGERAYLFVHGMRYTGPTFKYCPFCGTEFKQDTPEKNENS